MNPLWFLVLIVFINFVFEVYKFWSITRDIKERQNRRDKLYEQS